MMEAQAEAASAGSAKKRSATDQEGDVQPDPYDFDCATFTNFEKEDEEEEEDTHDGDFENVGSSNADGYFAVRHQYKLTRENIPDEWMENLHRRMNAGRNPQTVDDDESDSGGSDAGENGENQNSLNFLFGPGHATPNPRKPLTPDSEDRKEVVVDEINIDSFSYRVSPKLQSPLYFADEVEQDGVEQDGEAQWAEGSPVPDLVSPNGEIIGFDGAIIGSAAFHMDELHEDQSEDEDEADDDHVDGEGLDSASPNEVTLDEYHFQPPAANEIEHQVVTDKGADEDDVDEDSPETPSDFGTSEEDHRRISAVHEDEEPNVDEDLGAQPSVVPVATHAGAPSPAAKASTAKLLSDTATPVSTRQAEQTTTTPASVAQTRAAAAVTPGTPQVAETPAPTSTDCGAVTPPPPTAGRTATAPEVPCDSVVVDTGATPESNATAEFEDEVSSLTAAATSVAAQTAAATAAQAPHPDTPASAQEDNPALPSSPETTSVPPQQEQTVPDVGTPASTMVSPTPSTAGKSDFVSRIPRPSLSSPPGAQPRSAAKPSPACSGSLAFKSRIPTSGTKSEAGRSRLTVAQRVPADSSDFPGGTPGFMLPTNNWTVSRKEQEALRGNTRRPAPGSGGFHGKSGPKPVATSRLTEPQAPTFLSDARRSRPAPLDSETAELEHIRRAMEERQRELAKRPEELKRVNASNEVPKPEKKPLTKAEGPTLRLDQRLGAKTIEPPSKIAGPKKKAEASKSSENPETSENANSEGSATAEEAPATTARPASSQQGSKNLTRPKDFQFATDKRIAQRNAGKDGASKKESTVFESLASMVHNFAYKIPSRFKHNKDVKPPAKSAPLQLTEPEEPKFVSNLRARPVVAKSREQREEEEMKNFKPFKALPLSEKVLNSHGEMGVPKVEKKPTVVPEAFNFRTDQRARRPGDAVQEEPQTRPRRLSHGGNRARGSSEQPKPTRMAPFNLRTDHRATMRPAATPSSVVSDPEHERTFHARPMPDFSRAPTVPAVAKRELVAPAPFNLQSLKRHEVAIQRRMEELQRQQEEEERARYFKARPMCVTLTEPEVRPSDKPLTEPATPVTLKRSIEKIQARNERLALEREEEERRRRFHARGLPQSTFKKAFEPTLPGRAAGSLDIKLNSDTRAEQRREFDRKMNEKARMEEEQKRLDEDRKRQEEEEATREYRKSLTWKARPMPRYFRGSSRMPTPAPLTQPESPFLMTKARGNVVVENPVQEE